jgi:hypothetical protein
VDNNKEVSTPPLKHYDDSIWDNWSMYDNMPYVWDPDLNVMKTFKYESGNIIKAYRYKLQDPYELKHE